MDIDNINTTDPMFWIASAIFLAVWLLLTVLFKRMIDR